MPAPGTSEYPAELITLDEAKLQLNITSTTDDVELQSYINAATDIVTDHVGQVVPQSFTETYDGGRVSIALRHTPVLAVTAVFEYMGSTTWTLTNQPVGSAVDYYGFSLDNPTSGLLTRRGTYSSPVAFLGGCGNVEVTYLAGMAAVPASINLATRIIVQHLWETQRGAGPMPLQPGGADQAASGMGFAVPNRAVELMHLYARQPGIA